MSQQELAVRAGMRREKVNRVESKGEDISFEDLWRLLDAVGLELVIREKEEALSPSPFAFEPQLERQKFSNQASLFDGSKARILSWGKVPK